MSRPAESFEPVPLTREMRAFLAEHARPLPANHREPTFADLIEPRRGMFQITSTSRDDGMHQTVTVLRDGAQIGTVNTQADCPEDNNCERLGIAGFAGSLLVAAGISTDQIAYIEVDDEPED